MPLALPGNPIQKGRASSTANLDHLLHQLLFSHGGTHGHIIIWYLHDILDDRQCVRYLSSMLLLYKLLPVRRPGRRFFIRWDNPRVRDFGIPSYVARLILPCYITPLSLIIIEPRTGVSKHISQHIHMNLRDIWRMFGDVMYKPKLPLNPLR